MRTRNLTDAVTNHTVFSSEELRESLPYLLAADGRPPASLMPTFLHEATHHWCFSSSVGSVLALLSLRGRVRALQATEAATRSERASLELSAVEDITRAEVTFLLLRPLAEGLATFAEFDLAPSLHSPGLPPPLRWTVLFYARSELYGDPTREWVRRRLDGFERTAVDLATVRHSAEGRRRKAALLAQPLSCEATDGYLAGYLLVKNLWRWIAGIDQRFARSDSFLLYVYDLIYEDAELSRLLVDETQSLPESLSPIVNRLRELIYYSFRSDPSPDLSRFYDALADSRRQAWEDDEILPLTRHDDVDPTVRYIQDWRRLFGHDMTDLFQELGGDLQSGTASQRAEVAYHALAYSRDLLSLGSVGANVRVRNGLARVEIDNKEVVALPTETKERMDTDGLTGVFLGTRTGRHIAYATAGSRLIGVQITPSVETESRLRVVRGVLGRLMLAGVDYEIQAAEAKLGELDEFRRIPGYLQQTRERLNGLYCPLAVFFVPEKHLRDAYDKLLDGGLYGLFGENADLVRGLAAIGGQADLYRAPDQLATDFAEIGLDYTMVMPELEAYAAAYNLFGISDIGGMIRGTL